MRVFIILIFAIIGLRSLFSVPFYTSHDGFTHTARIAAYYKTLGDGQFPPRWAVNLNSTLGSPIFTYSYPLPYFLGSVIHLLNFSYQNTYRLIMAGAFILGSLGMYLWLSRVLGKVPGLVGSIFYMWVPYRFLNLYVRGAFAENLAYAILPFCFLTIEFWPLFSLSIAALLLSHNVVAFMALPMIFLWGVLKKKTKKVSAGMVFGFLMSAFIYFPDLFERGYIRFDAGISYYKEHFVNFYQLLRSPWGYGFDLPGIVNDAMSFQLGLAHLLALGIFLILFFKKRSGETVFFLGVFILSVFLLVDTPYIVNIWKIIPALSTIVDFPWRFLGIAVFALSVLAAYAVKWFRFQKLLTIFLLMAVLIANRNFIRINESLNYSDKVFDEYTGTSTANSNEYLPILHKSPHLPARVEPVEIDQGNAKVEILSRNAWGMDFKIETNEAIVARINRFYFPQTKIYRDGNLVTDWEANREPTTSKFDDTGTISLKVFPPGGFYQLKFEETNLRVAANTISLISFFIVLCFLIKKSIRFCF